MITVSEAGGAGGQPLHMRLRSYFWSDRVRAAQTLLGLFWLLDGGLQFQAFMYSHGFPRMLVGMAQGQPLWLHDSMVWGAKLANANLGVWNTLFALAQVGIGLGILNRASVRWALGASLGWALIVWWFGEGFGMLFMNMAMPLTGAPGAVLLYALVGALVWPGAGPGGLLGRRGARSAWVVLWLGSAWLWLLAPSSSANGVSDALQAVPTGIAPIDSLQHSLANATRGAGLVVALCFAALSVLIALAPVLRWRAREWVALSMLINLVFWVTAQGFGGIPAGGATDPNSGPVFVLLAWTVMPLLSGEEAARS